MAVCLHCRHAELVAAQQRRTRVMIRGGLALIAVVSFVVVGRAGVQAALSESLKPVPDARAKKTPAKPAPRTMPVVVAASRPVFDAPTVQQQGVQGAPATPARADTQAKAPPSAAPAAASAVGALSPILLEGRSELGDSLFAVRTGNTVVVNFDTSPTRTRRADKFDAIVRRTLRSVYGAVADSLLATIPEGKLASPAELLTELPERGIHLPAPNGETLTLWPQTRPGRDGPLVVAYRAEVGR